MIYKVGRWIKNGVKEKKAMELNDLNLGTRFN